MTTCDERTAGRDRVEAEVFGPYRLDGVLGRGGMGEVFRAFDTRRNRVVALKRMSRSLAVDPEYRMRFQRESALAARLREPHIIPIHDYGEIDGQLYIDMRLVEGSNLATVLQSTRLSVERAFDVISQIADALDAAHAEGLVHRDVKPSNVLLVGGSGSDGPAVRGFAYLADFGVAATLAGSTMSRPGLAVGTATYMAPERMAGERCDLRIDVYSLACVLFECLVGRRPFVAADLLELLQAHLRLPPPRPSELRSDLPPGIDDVIAIGMAKKPEDRYASAGELAQAARALLDSMGALPRPAAEPGITDPAAGTMTEATPVFGAGTADPSGPADPAPPAEPPQAADPASASDPDLPARPALVSGSVLPSDPTHAHEPADSPALVDRPASMVVPPPVTGPRPSPRPRPGPASPSPIARPHPTPHPSGRPGSGPRPGAAVRPSSTARPGTASAPGPTRPGPTARPGATSQPGATPQPGSGALGPTVQLGLHRGPESVPQPDPSPGPDPSGAGPTIDFRAGQQQGQGDQPDPTPRPRPRPGRPPQPGQAPSAASAPADALPVSGATEVIAIRRPATEGERRGRLKWVTAVVVFGVALVTAAIVLPPLLEPDDQAYTLLEAIPVGVAPAEVALSPDGTRAYVTNLGEGTVSVIDTATSGVVGAPIPVGTAPNTVAVSPDGTRAYVSNNGSDSVSVIDTASATVVATVPVGAFPDGLVIDPQGLVYVGSAKAATVSVIDPAANEVVGEPIPVGAGAYGLAISPDGTRLYVPAFDEDSVAVVDTALRTVTAVIPVGDAPLGAAVSPDGATLYVTNQGGGTVSVIDTAGAAVRGEPIPVGTKPSGVAVSRDGTRVVVTVRDADRLVVIDATDRTVGDPIPAGDAPVAVAVAPDDERLYVISERSNDLSVFATTTG